jgi:hypothetical protein
MVADRLISTIVDHEGANSMSTIATRPVLVTSPRSTNIEIWLRHQSARIRQRHLQLGQHWRLDLDAVLGAAAQLLPKTEQARDRARIFEQQAIAA